MQPVYGLCSPNLMDQEYDKNLQPVYGLCSRNLMDQEYAVIANYPHAEYWEILIGSLGDQIEAGKNFQRLTIQARMCEYVREYHIEKGPT